HPCLLLKSWHRDGAKARARRTNHEQRFVPLEPAHHLLGGEPGPQNSEDRRPASGHADLARSRLEKTVSNETKIPMPTAQRFFEGVPQTHRTCSRYARAPKDLSRS